MTLATTSACVGGRHVSAMAAAVPACVSPIKAASPARRSPFADLTPRERHILDRYIALGMAKAVAREVGLAQKTVEVHLANVRRKSGFSRLILLAVAYDREQRQQQQGGFE